MEHHQILEKVCQIVAYMNGVENAQVFRSSDLRRDFRVERDFNGDKTTFLQLAVELEGEFDIEIYDSEIRRLATPEKIAELVGEKLSQQSV